MTKKQTLLAIFAHPDDESFGTGGTLAHYATKGVHVALVCATRGEVGEIATPDLATVETLGDVREAELYCACQALGISDLNFLDYRDSGMAGTPENDNPRAFVNAPTEKVVARLVGIIRRLRPHVIVTFEPNGGYGHPDHIAIHRHTVAAFHAAGNPDYHSEQGLPWQPSRLFYTVIPHSFFQEMRNRTAALGIDVSDLDRFEENDVVGWPDEQVHVTLDVTDTVEAKWAALQCHRTQFGPDNIFRRMPEAMMKQMMSREYFALAWPQPATDFQLPDLFVGLPENE